MRPLKALAFFAALLLIPTLASGQQCYQVTSMSTLPNSNPYGASFLFNLTSASCTSTPSGTGWYEVHSAPYELHVAVPYSINLTGCYLPFYYGEGGSTPIVPVNLVGGLGCGSFPRDPNPPACTALNSVSLSGPSQTYLYHSHPFTANVSGGQSPYTYRWSIRFHHVTYGWSSWSTFTGSQTTTASSSSCNNDKYQIRVEVTESSCGAKRTSNTKTVNVLNYACPW